MEIAGFGPFRAWGTKALQPHDLAVIGVAWESEIHRSGLGDIAHTDTARADMLPHEAYARAPIAGFTALNGEALLASFDRVGDRHHHLGIHVGTSHAKAPVNPTAGAAGKLIAKLSLEELREARSPEATLELFARHANALSSALATRRKIRAVLPILTELVVAATLFGVGDHLIGFTDRLEAFLRLLALFWRMAIGVPHKGELAVSLFDSLGRCITPYAERLIVVLELHYPEHSPNRPVDNHQPRINQIVWPLVAAATLLCSPLAGSAFADPSAPDATFGTNGIVIEDHGRIETGGAVVQLATGKLLQLGRGSGALGEAEQAFSRYNPNGVIDASYGTNGTASGHFGEVNGFELQPDDSLLVASEFATGSAPQFNDAAVMRYTATGAKDTSFGTDGRAVFRFDPLNPFDERATAVTRLASGKLLVGGYIWRGGVNFDVAVVRLSATGALDTTFGDQGYFIFDLMGGLDKVVQVHELPDGRLIVYGEAQDTVRLGKPAQVLFLRLSSEGVLDQTFGNNGSGIVTILTDVNSDQPGTMIPLANGKFLFAIIGTAQWTAALLKADGTLDEDFGNGGIASIVAVFAGTSFPLATSFSLARQTDGRIVVGGRVSGATPTFSVKFDAALARFEANGTPDTSFNSGSPQRTYDISGPAPENPRNVIVQDDGKILLGGYYPNGVDDRFMLRVNGDTPTVNSTTTTSPTSSTSSTIATTSTTLECCDVCGDVNGDGVIRSSDALSTLQAAVGLFQCALSLCDANGDGFVRSNDALLVLKFAVGLSVELICAN